MARRDQMPDRVSARGLGRRPPPCACHNALVSFGFCGMPFPWSTSGPTFRRRLAWKAAVNVGRTGLPNGEARDHRSISRRDQQERSSASRDQELRPSRRERHLASIATAARARLMEGYGPEITSRDVWPGLGLNRVPVLLRRHQTSRSSRSLSMYWIGTAEGGYCLPAWGRRSNHILPAVDG
jgi:hypothetical protein